MRAENGSGFLPGHMLEQAWLQRFDSDQALRHSVMHQAEPVTWRTWILCLGVWVCVCVGVCRLTRPKGLDVFDPAGGSGERGGAKGFSQRNRAVNTHSHTLGYSSSEQYFHTQSRTAGLTLEFM